MNTKRFVHQENANLSFAEILEHMREQDLSDSISTKNPAKYVDFFASTESPLNTELFVNTPVFRFANNFSYYSQQPFKKDTHPCTSFQLKAEGMSPEQFKAYEFLFYSLELPVLKAHQMLPEKFNSNQLKKAFKIAALKNHPDVGGTHESFLELKKSYEILLDFVKTKSHAAAT